MSGRLSPLSFLKYPCPSPRTPPILFIHGMLGYKDNFIQFATGDSPLVKSSDVYMIDMRNHGQSPHGSTCTIADFSGDIIHFMDEQRLGEVILCGHSLGGKVSMRVGMDRPDRVKGMIIADFGPFDYTDRKWFPRIAPGNYALMRLLISMELEKMTAEDVRAELLKFFQGKKPMVDFMMGNLGTLPDGTLHWKPNIQGILNSHDDFASYVPGEGEQYPGPALCIYGTKSDFVPVARMGEYEKFIPSLRNKDRFKPIEAGHWLHFVDPESFLRYVQGFQQSLH